MQPYRSYDIRMADLEVLLGPHVHDFQGRVGQLDYVTWLERFGIDVIDVVRMEYARSTAVQNGLLAWGVSKAETTPAVSLSVSQTKSRGSWMAYLGCFVGAQTMAMLSGIMTWYPTWVCRSLLLIKQVCVG